MRILVVNWQDRLNPQAGGAEVHVHEIFGRLARGGHDVCLLVSGWDSCAEEETVDGIQVVRCGSRYTFPLHVRRALRTRLAGESFDVVVEDINKVPLLTPLWIPAPVVGLVPHLFGATAFEQESLPVAATVWLAERLMPAAYRHQEFVVISKSTAADMQSRGFSGGRIHVSYPGVDHGVFAPGDNGRKYEEPTVAYVGRLRRYKGIDTVLSAVARLRDAGLIVRFLVVGQGDDRQRLERVTVELGLSAQVEFTGYVDEAEKVRILQRCWLNAYPSPKEGWGITNIEAAACGTPSVASDSPGLRESVRDGETGFLVPHRDVERWSAAMDRLVRDDALRARCGRAAIEYARRFTWEATAREVEGILNRVASR